MGKPSNKTKIVNKGHGGVRANSGRKAESFRKRCAELAGSPKFFSFAQKVFNREAVEPRLTKDGEVIYIEASVGDMVYLWEKLAAYGFGKPDIVQMSQITQEVQKLIDKNQQRELIEQLNYPERFNSDGSRKAILGTGVPAVQAPARPV